MFAKYLTVWFLEQTSQVVQELLQHTYICTYFACVCVSLSSEMEAMCQYFLCMSYHVRDSHLFPENSDSTHVDPKFPVQLSPFRLFSCNLPFHQKLDLSAAPGDSALVLTLRSSNEAGMKNQSLAKRSTKPSHMMSPSWTLYQFSSVNCCQSLWKI